MPVSESGRSLLAYTSPAWGHLSPIVPVLQELAGRGWQVHLRTLASAVPHLQAAGLNAAPLAPAIEALPMDDWQATSAMDSQSRAMRTFAARAPLDAADLKQAVDDVHPDGVLVDVMALGALAALEGDRLPYLAWLPYPAWISRPGVPPYGPGLAPLPGLPGRARDAVVRRVAVAPARRFADAANAGRAAVGLPPIASAEEVLLRPPRVLAMTSAVLEYPGAWPGNFSLVGPCGWDLPLPPPAWLADEHRPIVLVSTSSEYQRDEALVQTALAALADRDDLCVLVTVPGGDRDRLAGFDVPANARVERYVGHSLVLPRCAAVICHGGAGITHRAVAAGVPVVVVPFGRDQLEVARRVEVCGAGVRVPARRLTRQRLAGALRRAEALRPRARLLAEEIERTGGPAAAADLVEAEFERQRSRAVAH